MDPFTQRMLARAQARREKLGLPHKESVLEASNQRQPLQDPNQLQRVRVTTEVEVAVTNSGKEHVTSNVSVTPTKVESHHVDSKEAEEDIPKENIDSRIPESKTECTSAIRDSARSRLQRLGALYADSQISSPIHKTEGNFSAEQDDEVGAEQPHLRSGKSGTRLGRLAVLADTIKHWEDDLNHPAAVTCRNTPSPKKGNAVSDTACSPAIEETHSSGVPASVDQCYKSTLEVPKPKQLLWDQNIIAALEAQGFSRTQSKARLVYDYSKRSPQDDDCEDVSCSSGAPASTNKTLSKLATIQENASVGEENLTVQVPHSPAKVANNLHDSSTGKSINTPENRNVTPKFAGSPRSVPQMGLRVGSPHRRDASPKTGSVLQKTTLFESSTSPLKKSTRDPAELSVSERLALFERNKGQALIPKAAFSMPVPAKYLQAGDEDKAQQKSAAVKSTSPGKGGRTVESMVSQLQKSITEQVTSGNKVPKAVIPKSVPVKTLGSLENGGVNLALATASSHDDVPATSSKAMAQMFERGKVITAENRIAKNIQTERQKEMEMLLNRWQKNKQLASFAEDDEDIEEDTSRSAVNTTAPAVKQECSEPPRPPPLPSASDLSLLQRKQNSPKKAQEPHMSPVKSPQKNLTAQKSASQNVSPEKRHKDVNASQQYPGVTDVKRIRVSPPKPGRLYPCLSDIEANTETEQEDVCDQSISDEMDSSVEDTSFGREILQAAGIHKSPGNRSVRQEEARDSSSDDDSESESAVLEEIDDFLDEALGDDSDSDNSPSPPKRTRDTSRSPKKGCSDEGKKESYSSPTTLQSHSFKYSKGTLTPEQKPRSSPLKEGHVPSFVVEGNEQVPLMHTVSFYRRQQNLAVKGTPVRQIIRQPEPETRNILNTVHEELNEGSVRNKISELVDEVSKQQTVISQASQALNLCSSTVEFSGSVEEVEGERLLLVATHRRQAAMHEIQRLRVEGSLKPGGYNSELTERGSLFITNITLPLKRDYLRSMAADELCHHFVILVRAQEQVVATPVVAATSENLRKGGGAALVFPGSLRLDGLYSDFKVTLEIYNLQTSREVLPHDVKYHIAGKKEAKRLTPKKLKQDSRLVKPPVQSPAGPSAVRSPAFHMSGFVVFSLRELKRVQFTLNKVAYSSPLDGNIQLRLSSELELDVGERGFLTMFEDVSGFGAWHRRWCLLEGAALSYWKYPDDEKKKIPIGQIDLNICTTETVGLVSRDICARPHTFLLETTRPSLPNDEDSLVLVKRGTQTTIRHLLSADTREDRLMWCAQLNKALAMLRAWGSKASR